MSREGGTGMRVLMRREQPENRLEKIKQKNEHAPVANRERPVPEVERGNHTRKATISYKTSPRLVRNVHLSYCTPVRDFC